eukprot:6180864-Pleurochrysis_carterae.AAC.1
MGFDECPPSDFDLCPLIALVVTFSSTLRNPFDEPSTVPHASGYLPHVYLNGIVVSEPHMVMNMCNQVEKIASTPSICVASKESDYAKHKHRRSACTGVWIGVGSALDMGSQ